MSRFWPLSKSRIGRAYSEKPIMQEIANWKTIDHGPDVLVVWSLQKFEVFREGIVCRTRDTDAAQDHGNIKKLFEEFEHLKDSEIKQQIVETTIRELETHSILEEEIFYPAAEQAITDKALVDEARGWKAGKKS